MNSLTLILTAVVSGCSAYFGAYLRKKGENNATHEDIDNLVEQIAAVTTTQKRIEATISNEGRQLEIKKEVLFEVVKELAVTEGKLLHFVSAQQTLQEGDAAMTDVGIAAKTAQVQRAKEYMEAYLDLNRAIHLADVVCGEDARVTLKAIRLQIIEVAKSATKKDRAIYDPTHLHPLGRGIDAVINVVRKELGIKDAP